MLGAKHGDAMNRHPSFDDALDVLNEERDTVSIQISLLNDAETPDLSRLNALKAKLAALELRISKHRPEADA
jgi:chaperonin cofactor prefoldin